MPSSVSLAPLQQFMAASDGMEERRGRRRRREEGDE